MDIHAASTIVTGSGGTQNYGGVASQVPQSVLPGQVQVGFSANSLLNQQYIIQYDCWPRRSS